MKKILSLLLFLVFLTSCSVTPLDTSSFFINDLVKGNYYLVEYTTEETGTMASLAEAPVFRTIARINSSSPLLLLFSNGKYTGSFVHNDILYAYKSMHSTNSAVYSYTFHGRSDATTFTAYIGFIAQSNGLYVAKKKNLDAGTTLESTIAFYGQDNIDFSEVDGAPLYQKLGTTPPTL